MNKSVEQRNIEIALEAFNTLFNRRDLGAAERFWSSRYIQHSAHIPPGRNGLFDLVRGLPATLRYENHVAAASDDFVILHGRFSGFGQPAAWIVADIGTSSRTKLLGPSRAAVYPCLATAFRRERAQNFRCPSHRTKSQ
jgi:hypothetical protein